jgi:hypothetical protein
MSDTPEIETPKPQAEPVKPRGLVSKLCEIMAEIKWVEKRGRNEFHKYAYATEADLVEAVRGKMAARGIFLFPDCIDHKRTGELTDIMVQWTFVDGTTGESRTCAVPGCGQDKGDKGVYKALTGSEKYLLMKAFLIPTGDDPEGDEKVDKELGKKAAKAVADRKIAEHEERQEGVMLTEWKEGKTAISGAGLNILRSEMSPEDKEELGVQYDGREKVYWVKQANAINFASACEKFKIPVKWVEK